MKTTPIVLVCALTFSISSYADSSLTERRDKALEGINACLRRNEASSRKCKKLNENVETLVDVYRAGDKSVLPTLFRFTYLTDFYGDALLSDPDGFLGGLARLPNKDRQAVAVGIAGGMFRLRSKERFEAIRTLLTRIPDSSPAKDVSQICLRTLETNNASFFVEYFPPQTFTSRAADFQVYWYSRDMYALGEKPLWPPSSNNGTNYRFTYLGAFTGSTVITLTLQPDGTGQIHMKAVTENRDVARIDETATVPQGRLVRFSTRLDQAHFWAMPTELPSLGLDGAEWIMEGVQAGNYHVVVRWCPDSNRHSVEDAAFADAARLLFELAGHKHTGSC
jgi:hypothetical protein